jgi:hypothetical protein
MTRFMLPGCPLRALAPTATCLLAASALCAQAPLQEFSAPEARQGVAVDTEAVYVIDSRKIGKYDKRTGKRLGEWADAEDGPIQHLNSGVVIDGRLYCANSNYPNQPMTSSIEIWDTSSLEHVGNHSFGIYEGSATWVDFHDGHWWVVFANYATHGGAPGKGPEWTALVQFDEQWRRRAAWVLPQALVKEFSPYSSSGGAWGPQRSHHRADRGSRYCLGPFCRHPTSLRSTPLLANGGGHGTRPVTGHDNRCFFA